MDNILGAFISGIILIIFSGVSIYAFTDKEPMALYSGSVVNKDEITDIKKYNRAVGILWTCYTIPVLIAFIFSFINSVVGTIIMCAGIVIGFPIILIVYKRVYIKYSVDGKWHKPHYE